MLALKGVAGAGETTALAAVRVGAKRESYRVEGFAPTSRAAQKLADAGIASSTLQGHLSRHEVPHDGQARLYSKEGVTVRCLRFKGVPATVGGHATSEAPSRVGLSIASLPPSPTLTRASGKRLFSRARILSS